MFLDKKLVNEMLETFKKNQAFKIIMGCDPTSGSSSIMKIRDDGVIENLKVTESFRSNDNLTSFRFDIIDFSKEEPKDSLIIDVEDYEDLPK